MAIAGTVSASTLATRQPGPPCVLVSLDAEVSLGITSVDVPLPPVDTCPPGSGTVCTPGSTFSVPFSGSFTLLGLTFGLDVDGTIICGVSAVPPSSASLG